MSTYLGCTNWTLFIRPVCICLVYVFVSGGAPVGTPASRVLLGNVGSVSSSGLSHTPL